MLLQFRGWFLDMIFLGKAPLQHRLCFALLLNVAFFFYCSSNCFARPTTGTIFASQSGPSLVLLCFNIFSSVSCLNDFLSTFQWTSSRAASLLTYLQSGMKHQVTLVVLHNREDISATSRIYTLGYPSETRN